MISLYNLASYKLPTLSSCREKMHKYFRWFINWQRTLPSLQSHTIVGKYRSEYIGDQQEMWSTITAHGRLKLRKALRNVQGYFLPHAMIVEGGKRTRIWMGGKICYQGRPLWDISQAEKRQNWISKEIRQEPESPLKRGYCPHLEEIVEWLDVQRGRWHKVKEHRVGHPAGLALCSTAACLSNLGISSTSSSYWEIKCSPCLQGGYCLFSMLKSINKDITGAQDMGAGHHWLLLWNSPPHLKVTKVPRLGPLLKSSCLQEDNSGCTASPGFISMLYI